MKVLRVDSWSRARTKSFQVRVPRSLRACPFVLIAGFAHGDVPSPTGADETRRAITAEVDSLGASLAELDRVVRAGDAPTVRTPSVHGAFRAARAHYKRIEDVLEFYAPSLAAAFNSRRQEVDDDDAPPPSTLAPSGFPVLEGLLFRHRAPVANDSLLLAISNLRLAVSRARAMAAAIEPTDAQVIELTRLQLFRIATIGIAGFDAPQSGDAMRECAQALIGIRARYSLAGRRWSASRRELAVLDDALRAAILYLQANPAFAAFDRLTFLVRYAAPSARALAAVARSLDLPRISMPRPLRADAVFPYDVDAFDASAYAPRSTPIATRALLALGRRLFADPALSGSGTRSCASCHVPGLRFTDGRSRAETFKPDAGTTRNTPTIINAGLQPRQFDDERAVTLEDQVVAVLASRTEMASSITQAAAVVGRDAEYQRQFAFAFATNVRGAVSPQRLREALALFVRSQVALSSRFDRAVRGDTALLTLEERTGFNLFMGKAGCGTCHFAPLFSGVTPPLFVGSDVEVIGTPRARGSARLLDPDSGRAGIDHIPYHVGAFKTPSLRNVALTAPYMHNGVFRTLEAVVAFYNAGGGAGSGMRVPTQTLSADSLHLSAGERKAIIAFLGSLTDTISTASVQQPRVENLPRN